MKYTIKAALIGLITPAAALAHEGGTESGGMMMGGGHMMGGGQMVMMGFMVLLYVAGAILFLWFMWRIAKALERIADSREKETS